MSDGGVRDRGAELPSLIWPSERVIRPAKRRLRLRDLLDEGTVIRVLAARDFRARYKQSALGPLWLVIQPLALLAAFFVAFRGVSDVGTSGVPYLPFVLAGLSAWAFFQAAMTIGTSSLIGAAAYIKYTPCPRPAFPIAAVIASLPAYAITGIAAITAAAASGDLSLRAALLPLGLAWLVILTLGVIGISSALAVRYRDIVSALPLVLQLGVFLTPVGYPLAELKPTLRAIVELNPLTGVIEALRWMMLNGYETPIEPVIISLVGTALLAIGGWRLFTRLETTMADEI